MAESIGIRAQSARVNEDKVKMLPGARTSDSEWMARGESSIFEAIRCWENLGMVLVAQEGMAPEP